MNKIFKSEYVVFFSIVSIVIGLTYASTVCPNTLGNSFNKTFVLLSTPYSDEIAKR